jgi:hypothetical protein
MALPLDPTVPGALGSPGLGDDEIRALKQFLVDVWGFPVSPNAVGNPVSSVGTDGALTLLRGPIFSNLGDPAVTGQLQRNGSVLKFYNGLQVGSVPLVIDRHATPVIVANTLASTQLYAKALGANLLGTTGRLRFTAIGQVQILPSNVVNLQFNWVGAGNVFTQTIIGGSTSLLTTPWRWVIEIAMHGAVNTWSAMGHLTLTTIEHPSLLDHPGIGVGAGPTSEVRGNLNGTLDLSVDRTFQIAAIWSQASASNSFQYFNSYMELLP